MRAWMIAHRFDLEYLQVDANHRGMVPLAVFDFFDRYLTRGKPA